MRRVFAYLLGLTLAANLATTVEGCSDGLPAEAELAQVVLAPTPSPSEAPDAPPFQLPPGLPTDCVFPDGSAAGVHSNFDTDAYIANNTDWPDPNGIPYQGGNVLFGTVGVYLIWYGDWAPSTRAIVEDFVRHLGDSPYFGILRTYYVPGSSRKYCASGSLELRGEVLDNYSMGHTTKTDVSVVEELVLANIASHALPADTNALYVVLPAADTRFGEACTVYCGWHASTQGDDGDGGNNNLDLKISMVIDPTACPALCTGLERVDAAPLTPNGDLAADGVVSLLAHEIEETISDPDLNAWIDLDYTENADKCAWTFGSPRTLESGAPTNMRLGTHDYLIQRNWVNYDGGYCALSFP